MNKNSKTKSVSASPQTKERKEDFGLETPTILDVRNEQTGIATKMKFKVISYNEQEQYHVCESESGEKDRIDFMIDGSLPTGTTPEALVGATIEVESVYPYVSIATGVRKV